MSHIAGSVLITTLSLFHTTVPRVVCCSEELNRPENAYLKPMAEKVKAARAAVDAATPEGSGPISIADTLVLACKVATSAAWKEVKVGCCQPQRRACSCSVWCW